MVRSRIRAKRSKPRRGGVKDRKYLAWAAFEPCCITGEWPATSHHVREFGSPKRDDRIIRLVARLHMHDFGPNSIERLGKVKFEQTFAISIEAEISRLRARYEGR